MFIPCILFRWKLIGLCIVFFICSPLLLGQKDKIGIRFDNISIKEGLSQSSPNCIFQDSRGLMWIGTEDGLNKYDGYTFQVYKPEQNNEFSISHPRILSICEDGDGFLWIGTNGGGLNRYDPNSGRFYHLLPGSTDSVSLAGNVIHCIRVVNSTQLWIGSENGISVYDLQTGRFLETQTTQFFAGMTTLSMCIENENTIWVGTNKGLFQCDPVKNTRSPYSHSEGDPQSLPGNLVTTILIDKNHSLWVGTDQGLAKKEPGNKIFTVFRSDPNHGNTVSNNFIKALLEDDHGNIWIGTFGGGLDLWSGQTHEFSNFSYDYNNPYSLGNNEVLSIFRDFSGIIWVGTNGLDKYNPTKDKFVLYDYVPFTREKLVFRNIHPIYEDMNGILWIGSKSDGLHILDRINKRYVRLESDPAKSPSLASNHVRAIREYPEGVIWIGTEDAGLDKLILDADRKPMRVQHFKNIPGDSNSLTSNKIYAIFPDNRGKLWLGTDNGLTILDIESGKFTQYLADPKVPGRLSNSTVYCIYGDRAGAIWLATDFGVNRFDPVTSGFIRYTHNNKDKNSLIHNEILSFYEDSKGNLWIGTYGKGLDKFEIATSTFTHFASNSQLSTAVIYGILEDNSGNLWLSTNNGIIKFNPETGSTNQFSIEDGLQSNEFNGTSYFKSNNGEMFFGGQYGFNSFYPKDVIKDSIVPKIILSDLLVHNRSVSPGENSPIREQISEVKEIVLTHKQNNFTLYFSALHFANPAQNKYKYKLEGFDNQWIDAGNKRFVSYTSLPYKAYIFRILAANSDGIWNEKGLAVKIRIKPPFWATWWFRLLAIIAAVIIGLYLIRRLITIEQKQKLIFEKKFEESSKELEEAQTQLEKQHAEIVIQKRELILREKDQENLLWFNQGLGIFSDILSTHRDDMNRMCQVFVEKLVEYVGAQQGGLFLLNEETEEHYLELIANYAFSLEKACKHFKIGEGYVGSCYQSNQFTEVDNLTEKYSELKSGLGNEYLKHLLLAPLKVNEQCIGVLELGSFRKIKGYRLSFIEKLLETFVSIVNTQQSNKKLRKLFEYSTSQSKELEEREEQLRMNLEEIMATQEESARREDELIKLAEESATREEMLDQEIMELKARLGEKNNLTI